MDLPAIVRSQRRGQRRRQGHYLSKKHGCGLARTYSLLSHFVPTNPFLCQSDFMENIIFFAVMYFLMQEVFFR